jgi:KRAB domain-containing zinc finger protein
MKFVHCKINCKIVNSETIICESASDSIKYCNQKSHTDYDSKTVPNQCTICVKNFTKLSKLKDHMTKQHSNKNNSIKYECNICSRDNFINKIDLENHMVKNHISIMYCTICNKHFVNINKLKTHMKFNHCNIKVEIINNQIVKSQNDTDKTSSKYTHHSVCDGRRFECSISSRKFTTESRLDYHVKSEHKNENKYECKYCSKIFFHKPNLISHIKSHLNSQETQSKNSEKQSLVSKKSDIQLSGSNVESKTKNGNPFLCEICAETFNSETRLKKHVKKSHLKILEKVSVVNREKNNISKNLSPQKNYRPTHKCKLCKKSFKSNNMLKLHVNKIHEGITGACAYCGLVYKDVTMHIVKTHLDDTQYKCKYCTKTITGILDYKLHLKVEHTSEAFKKVCKVCKEEFLKQQDLTFHLQCAHGITKNKTSYLCHICAMVFQDHYELEAHIIKIHDPNYKLKERIKCHTCPTCKVAFADMSTLNGHISKIHKKNKFPCNICNAKIQSFGALQKHKYIMHRIGFVKSDNIIVDGHECPKCHRRYKLESTLINHYDRDHAQCTCDICDSQLLGKHSMKKHLEYSHGCKKKVYPCKKCDYVAVTKGRLQKHMVKHKKKKRNKK